MYDDVGQDIKISDVVEFYGIFTFDPELAPHTECELATSSMSMTSFALQRGKYQYGR